MGGGNLIFSGHGVALLWPFKAIRRADSAVVLFQAGLIEELPGKRVVRRIRVRRVDEKVRIGGGSLYALQRRFANRPVIASASGLTVAGSARWPPLPRRTGIVQAVACSDGSGQVWT